LQDDLEYTHWHVVLVEEFVQVQLNESFYIMFLKYINASVGAVKMVSLIDVPPADVNLSNESTPNFGTNA
jgi:hypothetical protein